MQKVFLVAVQTQTVSDRQLTMQVEELKELVTTAGGEVVGVLTQKRERFDSRTLIGKGKVEELAMHAEANEADLIIFYQQLTPSQNNNLQEAIDFPVIDRIQLILDIFAMRATSKEGKLQVALAQNEYLLPRLAGNYIGLSKLGGGIGTRGPGETKIEQDRRVLRAEIQRIKGELKEVEKHQSRTRENREKGDVFQLGLIGYTNAGKSTITNALTDAGTFEENLLFATLTPLTRVFSLNNHFKMSITDTVGFIQDLPPKIINAFHSTLEESRQVDLMLIVIDASSPYASEQEAVVMKTLKDLDMLDVPHLFVYNKMDLLTAEEREKLSFNKPNVQISARSEESILDLQDAIIKGLKEQYERVELSIDPSKIGQWLSLQDRIYFDDMYFDEETQMYQIRVFKPSYIQLPEN
ncbi:GTPase HflX [Aerococcus sp. 1KP-2016]|uniref:GTPase HflX n=1 Tax=Aerococcus sp. 1KP-2016 TaxID=1981982 RepID=UPI000B994B0E|nr:GTPase HflX [Aerococcus sp. 1KP-2016]OYQ66796.1 GTPase HflX [Aerococcus sp. 1KP-2016]